MGKLLTSYAAKVDSDPEPPVLVEPDIVDEPNSEVVGKSELESEMKESVQEVEEPLIETLVDLPAEPTMDLVPSLTTMRASLFLRLSDVYDPLQVFLQETCSHEINLLMVQSAVRSVFIIDDLHLSATYDWLDLPSFTVIYHESQLHLHFGSVMMCQC